MYCNVTFKILTQRFGRARVVLKDNSTNIASLFVLCSLERISVELRPEPAD